MIINISNEKYIDYTVQNFLSRQTIKNIHEIDTNLLTLSLYDDKKDSIIIKNLNSFGILDERKIIFVQMTKEDEFFCCEGCGDLFDIKDYNLDSEGISLCPECFKICEPIEE